MSQRILNFLAKILEDNKKWAGPAQPSTCLIYLSKLATKPKETKNLFNIILESICASFVIKISNISKKRNININDTKPFHILNYHLSSYNSHYFPIKVEDSELISNRLKVNEFVFYAFGIMAH